MKKLLFTFLFTFTIIVSVVWSDTEKRGIAEMTDGAQRFLAALTSAQRANATFVMQDEERLNWHYIPRQRQGVALKQLTPDQRQLAHALLNSALSPKGYAKATNIMHLDQVLYELENQNPIRDPHAYFFTIFGEPSETGEWGWRVEGHHLSLNFTIRQGRVISTTPSFMGANPAHVRHGSAAGLRVLAEEEDRGRRLVHSLTGSQRDKVIIDAKAPADIITGASRKAQSGPPVGVAVADMTREQARMVMDLVDEYAHRLRPELAEADLAKLRKAGVGKIHFAWAGGAEPGQPHYYRIQGPTFVIEYDNTQNNANHVHTVWRDFEGDFGLDLLREHYERSHHHGHHLTRVNEKKNSGEEK
jgi:hypothetical protein